MNIVLASNILSNNFNFFSTNIFQKRSCQIINWNAEPDKAADLIFFTYV
jgi:hypothetical protein